MEDMTMKHEPEDQTEGTDARPDEPGVPDQELDPITAGWATALGERDPQPNEDASADEVARGEDLETERPD
jgi:hypothetical protein